MAQKINRDQSGIKTGFTRIRKTGTQSIANNTTTTVTSWLVDGDTSTFVSATGIFTAPISGIYTFGGSVVYQQANTATYVTYVALNGTSQASLGSFDYQNKPAYDALTFSYSRELQAGDTLRVVVRQNSGGARTLHNDSNTVFMFVSWIGWE